MTGELYKDADHVMQQSLAAFQVYKKTRPAQRAAFLEAIAQEIEAVKEELVQTAHAETNLPLARLHGEIGRTTGQLRLFAVYIREGSWVDAVIDNADAQRTPAKPDIRRMLLPVGPVVVFGASNFPFAFSTAGGDTASVLAAGATAVIKAHPAHGQTSAKVFAAIQRAIAATGMPPATVLHVAATGNEAGKALVVHPHTSGVAFTGSYAGGKALVAYAAERAIPIPVFAEMGSVSPVILLPGTLEQNAAALAVQYAASITLGAGQFCTNPGLLLAMRSAALDQFVELLGAEINKTIPQKMLHAGICAAYAKGLQHQLSAAGITLVAQSEQPAAGLEARPSVASINAAAWLQQPQLKEELFGPFSLLVECADKNELLQVLRSLDGQLTSTVMATDNDLQAYAEIIEVQASLAGRIILNSVPTGVEVCGAMVHGGPYPATTDARFTSVGTSAIKRWVRPVCFQGFPDALLPDALKRDNPAGIWRITDDVMGKQ